MSRADDQQKAEAVAVHSSQADLFASRYAGLDDDHYASCFAYSRYRLDLALDSLLPKDGRGLHLLDVGCGTGYHLARTRARGFAVMGVDGSGPMLASARTGNPGVGLARTDVDRLPFPAASFDVVVCIEVLRYLPSSASCLAELARVLRPGGLCLVTASPLFNASGYPVLNRLATTFPVPGLVRLRQYFHTSGGLTRAMSRAGFSQAEARGIYSGLINWIERVSPRSLPRRLRALEATDSRWADRRGFRDLGGMLLGIGRR
jgi:ubiquinone/menaquinone biosynthesis C-methylase UbiE